MDLTQGLARLAPAITRRAGSAERDANEPARTPAALHGAKSTLTDLRQFDILQSGPA
jgi:hypothetical protein